MSVRLPAMSVLPPVRKDRIIAQLPQVKQLRALLTYVCLPQTECTALLSLHHLLLLLQCFIKEAALHTKGDFNNKVKTACQEQRTGTVG